MVLTLPNEFPNLNQIVKASTRHWAVYAKLKKSCTYIVTAAVREQEYEIEGVPPLSFSFRFFCKDKRTDPDNIAAGAIKMIMDALIQANVIENDGWKQVKSIESSFWVDKEDPRVEVEARPYGPRLF